MAIKEQDLAQKSSLTTSDYIRVVGSDNVSYKQGISDAADVINHLGAKFIAADTSVNDISDYGMYYCGRWADAPVSTATGYLIVLPHPTNTSSYRKQIYSPYALNLFCVRSMNNGTWTSWEQQPTRSEVNALTTKVNSMEMRSVTWSYTCEAGAATNTNLKTLIDADLPSGYTCLGVVGFTTNQMDIVPISVRYANSNYSCQIRNVSTTNNRSNTMNIYYLAQKQ